MIIRSISLRDFRSWEVGEFELGSRLTVLAGPNGSGKTNLLEAIYFGCTGRSCRTSVDRRVVKHGADVTRVELSVSDEQVDHTLAVALEPGKSKIAKVDGALVESMGTSQLRPLVIVFMPDRLALVNGEPSGRRSHMDQLAAAIQPSTSGFRAEYNRVLMQRNALISAIRSGNRTDTSLETWDARLAAAGHDLSVARASALQSIATAAAKAASDLGLSGEMQLGYKSSSALEGAEEFAEQLTRQRQSDIERGFTSAGPHRDDLIIKRDGRSMKNEGSQGEKRLALLSILLAEREAITKARDRSPLLLLDDVTSELDSSRRELLAERVSDGGQCVITATEFDHVPVSRESDVVRIPIGGSRGNERLRAA